MNRNRRRFTISITLLLLFFTPILSAQERGETPEQIAGPVSTAIHDLAWGAGSLYAVLDNGLVSSSDDGATWEPIRFPYGESREIAVTDDGGLWVTTSAGVALRQAGEETWSIVREGTFHSPAIGADGSFFAIEVSPQNAGDSVVRTSDFGESWDVNGTRSSELHQIVVTDDRTVWLLGSAGVDRSDNNGGEWAEHGLTPTTTDPRHIASHGSDLLMVTGSILYSTSRLDTSWQSWGALPLDREVVDMVVDPEESLAIAFAPAPRNNDTSLFVSEDSGATWAGFTPPVDITGKQATIGTLGLDEDGESLLIGTTILDEGAIGAERWVGQVFEWSGEDERDLLFTTSPSTSYILKVSPSPNGTIFASRYPQTIPYEADDVLMGTLDSGKTWEAGKPDNADARSSTLTVLSDGVVLVAAGDSGLFRSTDNTENWERVETPEGTWIPLGDVIEVTPDLLLVESRVFFNRTVLYASEDGGVTWSERGAREEIRGAIGSAASPNGTVYIAETNAIYASSDSGNSWKSTNVASGGNYLVGLAIDGDGNGVAATFNGPIYRTADGGESWVKLDTSPSDGLFAITDDNGTLFVANRDGEIYRSRDNGESWTIHATMPEPTTAIRTLTAGTDGLLYIGTEERGVWHATLAGGRVSVEVERVNDVEWLDLR